VDDNIRRYVPSFPDKGVPITIRELMSHTSGIRHCRDTDVPDMPVQGNTMAYPTFEQAIAFFKDDPLLFTPGKYFFYSSLCGQSPARCNRRGGSRSVRDLHERERAAGSSRPAARS
jgi:hypothetical protein